MKKRISFLRKAGIAEGISFLVLLFIAMPLKYFFSYPLAVTLIGWIHGVLFMTFLFAAYDYKTEAKKNTRWFTAAFAAALMPAGTFLFDKKLKKEEMLVS